MTIQDFINEHNGQSLDWDGAYGAQCVDLAQYWAHELGTHTFTGDAKDIINQGNDGDYETVLNGPDNYPVPGDIIVFAANNPSVGTGVYGHVDICVDADVNSFTSFDQNWVEVYAHVVHHPNYAGVIGWLHPRVLDAPAPQPEPAPEQSQPAPSPVETAPAPAPVSDTPQTVDQSSSPESSDPAPVIAPETPSDSSLPENSTPVFTVKPVGDSPKAQPLSRKSFVKKLNLHTIVTTLSFLYVIIGDVQHYLTSTQSVTLLGVVAAGVAAVTHAEKSK